MVELVIQHRVMFSRVQVRISLDRDLQIADLTNKLKCLTWMARIVRRRACSVHQVFRGDVIRKTLSWIARIVWCKILGCILNNAKISILRWRIISRCKILIMASRIIQEVSNSIHLSNSFIKGIISCHSRMLFKLHLTVEAANKILEDLHLVIKWIKI